MVICAAMSSNSTFFTCHQRSFLRWKQKPPLTDSRRLTVTVWKQSHRFSDRKFKFKSVKTQNARVIFTGCPLVYRVWTLKSTGSLGSPPLTRSFYYFNFFISCFLLFYCKHYSRKPRARAHTHDGRVGIGWFMARLDAKLECNAL